MPTKNKKKTRKGFSKNGKKLGRPPAKKNTVAKKKLTKKKSKSKKSK